MADTTHTKEAASATHERGGPAAGDRDGDGNGDGDGCTLCGLPTPDPPATGDGAEGTFCCRGCLEVARTLDDAAAADPAAAREAAAPDTADADGETAYLGVEGMHCATCEAFLESEAVAHDGVAAADASYAAGLLKIVYDADTLDSSDLPELVSGLGYRAHLADEPGDGDDEQVGRLLVGGFFGMMTMLWYVLFLYPAYLGAPTELLLVDVRGPAGRYLLANAAVFAAVVLGYTGYPILRGAYVSLRAGRPNMDLLVALAATTAFVYSTAAALAGRVEVYYDVTVVVVMAVSLGGYYEDRIRERATSELTALAEERVSEATRRVPDAAAGGQSADGRDDRTIAAGGTDEGAAGTETVPIETVTPDDEVVVSAGERVPVDGDVLEGTAAVDNALVTGESVPERVEPGDRVVAGSAVADGRLVVSPDADGRRTVDRLLELLWEARSTRPGAQRLADRLAATFVPLVVLLAAGAAGAHLLLGAPPTGALLTGLAVLVVSCPCALGLATPLAVAAGIRDALRCGVVVADGETFERATDADIVALDKTGTLTTGEMTILETAGNDRGLELAAAVERVADHPVATAVVDHVAADPELTAPPEDAVTDFETHPGRGVSAVVDGERVVVGRPALLDAKEVAVPDDLREQANAATNRGALPVLVGRGDRGQALLVAGDQPREGWTDVVASLAADRRVVVLSGDAPAATERFADHPAVEEAFAGVPPAGKAEVVERLRADGTVAMVGDGSNDAPALAAADVAIAMGDGTALAGDAADAVVVDDDLATVPAVFDLTAATRRRVRTNLGWAFLYNAVALPAAAVGLLNPVVAAVAMAASSLLVVANSTRPVT